MAEAWQTAGKISFGRVKKKRTSMRQGLFSETARNFQFRILFVLFIRENAFFYDDCDNRRNFTSGF